MTAKKTVLFVHAHPDDETTKGGEIAAWLATQDVRTILVTCTDGSAGDVTDQELVGEQPLAQVRSRELAAAAQIMGFATVHELGHPDSGVDAEVAEGFANLDVSELAEELAAIFLEEAADIVVTYDPAYAKGHPDHLRCHDVSAAAFNQTRATQVGPKKLYGSRFFSRRRVQAMHDWLIAAGQRSPYAKAFDRIPEERFTTRINIGDHSLTARNALREHRTQIAHDNHWYYSIPDGEFTTLYPWADLELLAVAPGMSMPTAIETSLFQGFSG